MEASDVLCKYLGDMIAVELHCQEAIERQLKSSFMKKDSASEIVTREAHGTLTAHILTLRDRLKQLDGGSTIKEAVTTVSGFLAGIYDKMRGEALSRALRDNFAALHFVYVCETMLMTTATACNDNITFELVRRQQQEIPPLIKKVSDCIPAVVVADLEEQGLTVTNRQAATQAGLAAAEAWRGVPPAMPRP